MLPSAGSILLRDEVVSGMAPYQINRRGLSRSFQVTNVFANMSVWENLRCAVLWATGHRYAFWKEHRQTAGSARADRADSRGYQPHRPARRAGGCF